jgi:hypothetical protein
VVRRVGGSRSLQLLGWLAPWRWASFFRLADVEAAGQQHGFEPGLGKTDDNLLQPGQSRLMLLMRIHVDNRSLPRMTRQNDSLPGSRPGRVRENHRAISDPVRRGQWHPSPFIRGTVGRQELCSRPCCWITDLGLRSTPRGPSSLLGKVPRVNSLG